MTPEEQVKNFVNAGFGYEDIKRFMPELFGSNNNESGENNGNNNGANQTTPPQNPEAPTTPPQNQQGAETPSAEFETALNNFSEGLKKTLNDFLTGFKAANALGASRGGFNEQNLVTFDSVTSKIMKGV